MEYPSEHGRPAPDSITQAIGLINMVIVLSALGWGLFTSFYTVPTDSVAVVQRFGKYVRTTQPGLNFKIPFGVETVKIIPVLHIFKEEFGFATIRPDIRSEFAKTSKHEEESLMLTGDLNSADVEWVVQYRIKDPVQYAFNVRNARETLRNVSESVMRLVIGDRTVNEVLTSGREEIKEEHKKILQQILDKYKSGIEVDRVLLQDVTPPDAVRPSFNEVNEARQERERMINQAWEEYNRVIPKAAGEAQKTIQEAEGYYQYRVNKARGDAGRFVATWEAYKEAKDVTRKRLYLETMKDVLPNVEKKIILDSRTKGILPLLNLDQLHSKGGESQ